MTGPTLFTTEQLRVPGSVRDINNLFHERGWTDGLPIIPPTEDAVEEMLRFTDRAADDVCASCRHATPGPPSSYWRSTA